MTTRGRSNYALLTNKSGGSVTRGQTVIPSSTTDLSFTTTTTAEDLRVFGVVVDVSIANNAIGLVQIFGSIVEVMLTSAAVTRGHYLEHSTTAGKVRDTTVAADATTAPPTGAIGIALSAVGSAGEIAAFIFPANPAFSGSTVADFTDLGDVPASYVGQADKLVTVKNDESGLEFTTPGAAANIVATYNPDLPPTSPSAFDDEFNAASVDVKWTSFGTPGTLNTTDFPGFVHISKTGTAVDAGLFQTYVPGAAAFTVVVKVSGDVTQAGSNQVLLAVATSAGAFIVDIGMLNGKDAIVGAAALSGGFDDYEVGNGNDGLGTVYYAITRDATTNYKCYISQDGITWLLLATFSQAGTVGRIYINVAEFAATTTAAYYDFVRVFTSQTLKIGNTP